MWVLPAQRKKPALFGSGCNPPVKRKQGVKRATWPKQSEYEGFWGLVVYTEITLASPFRL